ncbi:MAG: hypothetical protein AVDCRST_MAG07-232, partial [uncultured Frankineae bacterium]
GRAAGAHRPPGRRQVDGGPGAGGRARPGGPGARRRLLRPPRTGRGGPVAARGGRAERRGPVRGSRRHRPPGAGGLADGVRRRARGLVAAAVPRRHRAGRAALRGAAALAVALRRAGRRPGRARVHRPGRRALDAPAVRRGRARRPARPARARRRRAGDGGAAARALAVRRPALRGSRGPGATVEGV